MAAVFFCIFFLRPHLGRSHRAQVKLNIYTTTSSEHTGRSAHFFFFSYPPGQPACCLLFSAIMSSVFLSFLYYLNVTSSVRTSNLQPTNIYPEKGSYCRQSATVSPRRTRLNDFAALSHATYTLRVYVGVGVLEESETLSDAAADPSHRPAHGRPAEERRPARGRRPQDGKQGRF